MAVAGALGAGWLMAGGMAAAEVHPGETRGLGLMGLEIPAVLKTVAADPYRAPAEPACQSIPAELKALDEALGSDVDAPVKERSKMVTWAGDWARGAVRGLVPYRGVVRFLTGAGSKDKALMKAAMAGTARRGFLRGLEANMQCAGTTPLQVAVAPSIETVASPAAATAQDLGPIDITRQVPEPVDNAPRPILTSLDSEPGR